MAAAKKEYLENKQREFRFRILEGFALKLIILCEQEGVQEQKRERLVDPKMVCAFKITRYWRR